MSSDYHSSALLRGTSGYGLPTGTAPAGEARGLRIAEAGAALGGELCGTRPVLRVRSAKLQDCLTYTP